ncbi:MAG TPA: hypothetical protein VNB23_14655 [Ramlibacter sp.]|nr:hypothetical protein [Ramlibacter sp.]
MKETTWKALLALGLAALGAGCGGGGDDEPVTAESAAGVWTGTTSTQRDMTAILLSDGRYYMVYAGVNAPSAVGGLVQGTAAYADGRFTSADGVDFSLEGAGAAAGDIGAVLLPPFAVEGSLRGGTPTAVDFRLSRSPVSATVPTLAALAGDYPGQVSFSLGTRAATFAVTSAGAVSSVINACNITGVVAPRSDINAYDLTITFGGAPCVFPNLSFNGVAHHSGGRLVAAVRNTAIHQAIVFSGTR